MAPQIQSHCFLMFQLSSVDDAVSISVHVQYQCFCYAVTWENDHQRTKKSQLNEIDVQMAPSHLFLIILIVFLMICIMKDAVTPFSKSEFS